MVGFIACVALVFSILCFYEIHTLKKDKAKEDGGQVPGNFCGTFKGASWQAVRVCRRWSLAISGYCIQCKRHCGRF